MTRAVATVTLAGPKPRRQAITRNDLDRVSEEAGARVLLVDDDPVMRRSIARLLVRAGYQIAVARDGAEAFAILQEKRFHAVLSDIHMPRMSGLELLQELHVTGDRTPVVLLTGQADVPTAVAAVEHGAVRYLSKPFDAHTLYLAMRDAVEIGQEELVRRRAAEALREREALVLERHAELGESFDEALRELWIAFQPIVRWPENQPYGFETLMRSRGRLGTPLAILETAEALGRVHELGRAIRRRIAERLPELQGNALVFVNMHPSDLLDDDLYSPQAPLTHHARSVVLEITERASLASIGDLSERIAKLRALGYRIAVDDVGAGYAGLMAIAQLEPEVVKLDMSLVRDLEQHSTKRSLIGGMLAIANQLGTRVIAEGVETDAERDTLAALGCTLMQGYFFARPLPLHEALTRWHA